MEELLKKTREATGSDTASIMLPDTEDKHLFVAASLGLDDGVVNRPQPVGKGLAGRVFESQNHDGFSSEDPGLAEGGATGKRRLAASVPIKADKKVVGVLSINLETDRDDSYLTYCEMLEPLAESAAQSVD